MSRLVNALQVPIDGKPPTELIESVREDLATAIAFICRSEDGRKALMAAGGHETLKCGYEYEEHAGTMAAMEEAARSLMGVEVDEEGADDDAMQAGGMIMMA